MAAGEKPAAGIEEALESGFRRRLRLDGLVKSQKMLFSVIPAKAGIKHL
jgi:hypothetical protein